MREKAYMRAREGEVKDNERANEMQGKTKTRTTHTMGISAGDDHQPQRKSTLFDPVTSRASLAARRSTGARARSIPWGTQRARKHSLAAT